MKIRPVGAELFRAERQIDRRTDITKLIVAFRNFANALKKLYILLVLLPVTIYHRSIYLYDYAVNNPGYVTSNDWIIVNNEL